METTYQDIIAQKRAAYEAKRAELEKELIELKERFDDERRIYPLYGCRGYDENDR